MTARTKILWMVVAWLTLGPVVMADHRYSPARKLRAVLS